MRNRRNKVNQPSKKIYGIPLTVTQRVNRELEQSNDRIILLVLERMEVKMQQAEFRKQIGVNEDWHAHHTISGMYDRGCGCGYCQAVHRYVNTKVSAHRLRRKIDDWDYMCRPYENPVGYSQLKLLEKEWPKLREISHQLKESAGI